MKVIFATHEGVPLYGGGPAVKIEHTRRHLREMGVDIKLFDMWDSPEKILDADLVHLFSANFPVHNLARILKIRGMKFVVNPIFFSRRSASFIRMISALDRLAVRFIPGLRWDYGYTRDICQWADRVLPNTTDEGKLISRGMGIPAGKMRVIHNGVSSEFFNADPDLFKKKYGLENFILTVGHMGPVRKNMLNLVRALARIDHPSVLIVRIMDTGETPQVLREARRNKQLMIIDGLPNDSPLLASAYAACDVFVLPSRFETPGRAALEAGLAGAKVVITPYGGTREYFADLADYVDPYSVESIRRGIEKALNRPRSNQLRERIKNNFLWKKIASETLQVYQEVLQNDARRG